MRATVDPGHNGVAHYTFTPADVLRSSPRFPGPSAPGGTMVAALRMGLDAGGEDLLIYGAADAAARRSWSSSRSPGSSVEYTASATSAWRKR